MCLNFSTEMTAITRERNEKYYYTINLNEWLQRTWDIYLKGGSTKDENSNIFT